MSALYEVREVAIWHRQDVRAALSKQYGSVTAFARAKGYNPEAVRSVLHGKSKKLLDEIGNELGFAPGCFIIQRDRSRGRDK